MKTKLRKSQKDQSSRFFNGMLAVKGGRGWINWFKYQIIVIRGKVSAPWMRAMVVFLRACYRIYMKQGVRGLVLRTKSCHVLLMQSAAGMKIPSTQALGPGIARTKGGLPREIPRVHRLAIRNGDHSILKIYLSLYSIYRVLSFKGILKLETITKPGVILSYGFSQKWEEAVIGMSSWLGYKAKGSLVKEFPKLEYTPLLKSSPSLRGLKVRDKISTSPKGIVFAALALSKSPQIMQALLDFISFTSPHQRGERGGVEQINLGARECFKLDLERLVSAAHLEKVDSALPRWQSAIGGLGFKPEAAGKVRVFAMVDCWTQWALRPLHLAIFDKVLPQFKTDGTHDQLAPVRRLLDSGLNRFWCYDLSAATDRLPISLQERILCHLIGDEASEAWANLLVGRDYLLPSQLPDGIAVKGDLPRSVRYAVGQPMGALSSWAMLALTHHYLVAMAAKRAGYQFGLFNEYAVLGDDIVIARGTVAREYLNIMKEIGVEIGLAKSLVTRKGFLEFAKRYLCKEADCSPVPFLELWTALHSFASLGEFTKKYSLSMIQLASLMGLGYKAKARLTAINGKISRKLRVISVWYYSPWGPAPLELFSWFNHRRIISVASDLVAPSTEMYRDLPANVSDYLASEGRKLLTWCEKYETKLKGYVGTFKRNPCKLVSDKLFAWSGDWGPNSLMDALYLIYREFIDEKVGQIRRDLAKLDNLARDLRRGSLGDYRLREYFDMTRSVTRPDELHHPGVRKLPRVNHSEIRYSIFWGKSGVNPSFLAPKAEKVVKRSKPMKASAKIDGPAGSGKNRNRKPGKDRKVFRGRKV